MSKRELNSYPHIGQIEDESAQQALRILFDRLYACEKKLIAANVTITQLRRDARQLDNITKVVVRHEAQLRNG